MQEIHPRKSLKIFAYFVCVNRLDTYIYIMRDNFLKVLKILVKVLLIFFEGKSFFTNKKKSNKSAKFLLVLCDGKKLIQR